MPQVGVPRRVFGGEEVGALGLGEVAAAVQRLRAGEEVVELGGIQDDRRGVARAKLARCPRILSQGGIPL
jgi:hypothetical protein